MKKHILLILISFVFLITLNGQSMRSNSYLIKLSISRFKDFYFDFPYFDFDNEPNVVRKYELNVNLHFSIRPTLISEFGINGGFVKYAALNPITGPVVFYDYFYAPIVGFNYNMHILPFLNIPSKKIDLYLTSNYGFAYLSKIGEQNLWEVLMFENENESKIRHFYGLGLGGSVLLFNSFGIFIETLFGNYSLRSELVSSYSNTKIGIQYSW